jgi:hypothetical protein
MREPMDRTTEVIERAERLVQIAEEVMARSGFPWQLAVVTAFAQMTEPTETAIESLAA